MESAERVFLRRKDVERVTGFTVSTLYRLAQKGKFPKQVKIGKRASAWLADEVQAWADARVAASRKEAA